jgi:Zn-dependent alcohol dehydrogenase
VGARPRRRAHRQHQQGRLPLEKFVTECITFDDVEKAF